MTMKKICSSKRLILISVIFILFSIIFSSPANGKVKTRLRPEVNQTSRDSVSNKEKEKKQLKERLDGIQSKLEYIVIPKTESRAQLLKTNNLLILKIKHLKENLSKPQGFTSEQLKKAEEDVNQLDYFVSKYCSDIESLKVEFKELEDVKKLHKDS